MNMEYPIRINKYLALNNFSTRVGGDELIKKGLVTINGKLAVLGDKVNEGDEVVVKTKGSKKEYVYYAYNKDVNVSTNPDPASKDILQVTRFPVKVFPVGRLDKDSHGLIIVTNDGRVTDRLLSPKYVHEKEYTVKVEKPFSDTFLTMMGNGVRFDKFVSKKCKIWRMGKSKDIFHIVLTEGKKRQIRRMCEALHHNVINLKRIRVMNIELDKIPLGGFREIKGKELETFLTSLNLI
ncbi:MAG: rRNA pseudouridine synthase [Candidatus Pacebacteria bacterium]|nr:rRNA pseudouridine synthase [Candidatus Paceibacterota bacterium]